MYKQLFYLLLVTFLFVGCGNDDPKDYTMNIKLEYDEAPLVMFDKVAYPSGQAMEITRFSFFISDLKLTATDGSLSAIDVDYIDLTESHADLELARNGLDYLISAPEADYSSISFNIGLTPAQNATKPQDYPSSNVLSNSGEYWPGWDTYIMLKIEGMIDLDGDGVLEKGIALHLGMNEVTRSVSTGFSGDDVNIVIDVKNIFECNGDLHDIVNTTAIHNLSKLPEAIRLMDKLGCALTFQ